MRSMCPMSICVMCVPCMAGASRDLCAAAELSPLHIAAGQGALMALATLLAAGAEPGARGERSGRSALHTACEHARPMAAAVSDEGWSSSMP